MKMCKYILILFTCLYLPLAAVPVQTLSPEYQREMYEQIVLQEQRAAYYLTQMQSNPHISTKFRQAEKMLEVKKILYKNFAQSPALNSLHIRTFLLELMRKEMIRAEDLIALQKMVNEALHPSHS